MAYVKIDENNIVVQKQPNAEDGFVSVHESIVCGMVHDGSESFAKGTFSVPANDYTWGDVRNKQREMIVEHDDLMEIHEREVAHTDTAEADYTITPAKYQEFLTYFQTIRVNDEATHASANDAMAALEALTPPALS